MIRVCFGLAGLMVYQWLPIGHLQVCQTVLVVIDVIKETTNSVTTLYRLFHIFQTTHSTTHISPMLMLVG